MSIRINDWFIAGNAQKTNSDWNATSGFAQILNKPTNLAHTTGNETLAGIKTFSSIPKSVTPNVSSNDTSVATTAYVVLRIGTHNTDLTAHNDIRQAISNISGDITSAINTHNSDATAHSSIRQAIDEVNNNIITNIDSHNINPLAHSDIRQTVMDNSDAISTVSNNLAYETSQRNIDVNYLQEQIDAISAKGDITDIVGTYADLQNYDTSALTDNSIIKVLTDSTHDNASSYYKWSIGTSSFSYIGSESPTYTKAEIDALDEAVVHKDGQETIVGKKIFNNAPVFRANLTNSLNVTSNDEQVLVNTSANVNNIIDGLSIVRFAKYNSSGNNKRYVAYRAGFRKADNSGNMWPSVNVGVDENESTFVNLGVDYATSPTPSSSTDNSTKIATTAWVTSHNAVDTNLVHRSGNETIGGDKTFSNVIYRTGNASEGVNLISFADSGNKGWTNVSAHYLNSRLYSRLRAINSTTQKEAYIEVLNCDDGTFYASIGGNGTNLSNTEVTDSTTLNKVPTMGWVNNPETSTNVVHRTGEENITGLKTFDNVGINFKNSESKNGYYDYKKIIFQPTTSDTHGGHIDFHYAGATDYTTRVIEDASGQLLYSSSKSLEASSSTSSQRIATVGWVNDPTKSTNVVHRSGDETITGVKTINNNSINFKSTTLDVTNAATTSNSMDINWKDKNGTSYGVDCLRTDTNGNVYRHMYCKAHNSNTWQCIGIGYNSSDEVYTYAPTPAASNATSNSNIATVGWVNDATKSTNVVHRSSDETITGTKTFSSADITFSGTSQINYTGTKSSKSMIRFIDNTSGTDGNGIVIGGGGAVVIGGGESATTMQTNQISSGSGGAERLLLCNDQQVDVYTYVQDGAATAKHFVFNIDGTLSTATSPAASDNSTKAATTAWVRTFNASDTNLVHKSGDETITGLKTIQDNTLTFKTTTADVTTTPSSLILRDMYFTDSTNDINNAVGRFGIRMETTGDNIAEVVAQNKTTGTLRKAFLKAVVDSSGKAFAKIDTDSVLNLSLSQADNTTTSTVIPTKGWVNNPDTSTNVVHRTGDETIGGNKTFSNTINGTAYRAQWGDLAEYYLTDMNYPKGTLVQFGGEKEITIAKNRVNAVITSEPGFILNSELENSQAIALIGRVPVRVIGKVKKFDKIALSYIEGVGCSNNDTEAPIGIALEDKNDSDEGLIICSVKLNFN